MAHVRRAQGRPDALLHEEKLSIDPRPKQLRQTYQEELLRLHRRRMMPLCDMSPERLSMQRTNVPRANLLVPWASGISIKATAEGHTACAPWSDGIGLIPWMLWWTMQRRSYSCKRGAPGGVCRRWETGRSRPIS